MIIIPMTGAGASNKDESSRERSTDIQKSAAIREREEGRKGQSGKSMGESRVSKGSVEADSEEEAMRRIVGKRGKRQGDRMFVSTINAEVL